MHQRPALHAGEDLLVELLLVLAAAQREAAARTPQRLVRRRGHDVSVRHGTRMQTAGDETGDVRHVDDEVRFGFVRDLGKARKVDNTRIRAGTRYDDLWTMLSREVADLIIVDASVSAEAVCNCLVDLAAEIDGRAVCEMAAM